MRWLFGYIFGNDTHSNLKKIREIIDSCPPDEAALILEDKSMVDGREGINTEFGDDLSQWPAPWVVLWSLHFSVFTAFIQENVIYLDEYFNSWSCEDNDFGI